MIAITVLLIAGVLLMVAGGFDRVVGFVLAQQLPNLDKQLTYKSVSVSPTGSATLREAQIKFAGEANGVELTLPKLKVSFHFPSLVQSLFSSKKQPRFSSVSIPEATLTWNNQSAMMQKGALAKAFGSIADSRDLQLIQGAAISIDALKLRPPNGWKPALFGKLPTLRKVHLTIDHQQKKERLLFRNIKMELYSGAVSGHVALPLQRGEVEMEAELQQLSLKQAATLFMPASVSIDGKLSGTLKATAPAQNIWEVKTNGRLVMSGVAVSGLHLQRGEVVQKRAPPFEVAILQRITVEPLHLTRHSLNWKMEGVGQQFDFKADGNGTTDGRFKMKMETTIHPSTHAKLPWMTQTGLKATNDGGSEVTLYLSGNLEQQRLDNYNELFRSGIGHGLRNTSRSLLKKLSF